MINKQLTDYIQQSLESGASIEQITPALVGQGWNQQDIKEAAAKAAEAISRKLNVAVPPHAPARAKKSDWNIEVKNLSASQVLLYLGGLIVVIAGVIYIGINWSGWGAVARVTAIFLPMLICYIVGVPMWSSEQRKKHGLAFIIVGALLFPLFLTVLFKEMAIFSSPYSDQFRLAVTTITLGLYVISAFIFRYPVWAFLYNTVGLFVLYFFFKTIGIESVFVQSTMAWLFLIIGTVYLFSSLLYDRAGHDDSGRYSYAIGALVVALSLIRLFGETFSNHKQDLSWLLLIFGVAYFFVGVFFENRGLKKYTQAPYFIGAGVVFLSLLRLGVDGTLLKGFTGQTVGYGLDVVGWSNVIVGISYLIIGYLVGSLKNIQLEEAPKYRQFFDLVSPLWILGALFYLGFGGHKPLYETLLLLVSLGFIFGSIPRLSRQYLLVGTLFLVIYIFSIGGEYFQNQVGWPVTLFVAGLISMGIGVAMEKVRRKYFVTT